MRKRLILAPIAGLALVASACGESENGDGGDGAWPDELTLTLTPSSEAQQLIEDAEPLADMIAERLDEHEQAPDGGITIENHVPTDYAAVIVSLNAGQADIAGGLGPQQMVQAERQADAELVLQSERFGDLIYVTQWFTNDPDTYCTDEPVTRDGLQFCNGVDEAEGPADGPIGGETLADVDGASVAFVDQGSMSGYAVPALQLHEAGVDPVDGVDGTFAGGHDNAVLAVQRGDADVGVSFNDARTEVLEQEPDVAEDVVVFGWSPPIPNDGFAVASDMPDDLRDAVVQALLDIAADPEGQEILSELYNIDDVVEVDSADYDVVRELMDELGDLLE